MGEAIKRIYDDVHGYIELSQVELRLVDSPYLQRLKNIRQLSTAYHVYPGATHTRFSHSIGTMHVMGEMGEALRRQGYLDRDEVQLLRLAALLHDIGHYPYSHTIEEAYMQLTPDPSLRHESIGARIVREAPPIREVLQEAGYDPGEIADIIEKRHRNRLYNQLINSDVDADKIDYLLRDAKHSGVAYGNIDAQRIAQTITVDDEGNLAVQSKGVEAVENLYVGRLHMYRSVYMHKTVVSLELLLIRLYKTLILQVGPDATPPVPDAQQLRRLITTRDYTHYNDNYLATLIHTHALSKPEGDQARALAEMFLLRRPLKLAFEAHALTQSRNTGYEELKRLISSESALDEIAEDAGAPKEWIYTFTSEVEMVGDREAQARICERPGAPSRPITETASIIARLPRVYRIARIYCREDDVERVRRAVAERLKKT